MCPGYFLAAQLPLEASGELTQGGVRTLLAAPPPKQHSHTNPASYAGYMSRRNTVFQTVVDSAEGPGGRPATLLIFRPN